MLIVQSSGTHADSSQCYSPSNKESWESLVFESVKEIEDFYGNYAYNIGFSIRSMLKSKNNSQNKESNKVHYMRYVRNKQGFKRGNLLNPKNKPTSVSPMIIVSVRVKEKPEARIGCKAGI
ncbi:hypothetical protein QL285_039340 [Trifolium repens]|jgi:hypothetical protein|nr:hypothetical protein QL285_039340 [Trifolium repens]